MTIQFKDAEATPTVKDLESHLFSLYPRSFAEPWDKVGLSVGDPAAKVFKVAFALDATKDTVEAACERGANVLVTHHPVCLEMPRSINPASPATPLSSGCLWEAVARGVAVVSMHTNLDRSTDATRVLPELLGLTPKCGIELGRPKEEGRLGSYAPFEGTVLELATRCKEAFGRVAQVYGKPEQRVTRAAFFTGSLGDCGVDALSSGANAVVCGECGYHRALELESRGCAVIILGHDVSELPLVNVLYNAVSKEFLPPDRCMVLDMPPAWFNTL